MLTYELCFRAEVYTGASPWRRPRRFLVEPQGLSEQPQGRSKGLVRMVGGGQQTLCVPEVDEGLWP